MKAPTFNPGVTNALAKLGFAPRYTTAFDSSTLMQGALAKFLHGKDFSALGMSPFSKNFCLLLSNLVPLRVREWGYQYGGKIEAIPAGKVRFFRAEAVSEWLVSRYPKRRYPMIMVGSSNGAAIHLAAALGIPWLPQNSLMLVQYSDLDPDEPMRSIEAGRPIGLLLRELNPELQLHQMQDPVQDRLMTREALYFRIKRIQLGRVFERFIQDHLEPGGTILILDCQYSWPVVKVSEGHYFQLGGEGALSPPEYYNNGPVVREFLKQQGASRLHWEIPKPDAEMPEAEWGYAPQLTDDILRLARKKGFHVQRLQFDSPEGISPWVAELYQYWYQNTSSNKFPTRLIIEPFFLLDPWCILRSRSIPFWVTFNAQSSVDTVETYLDQHSSFDEIRAILFSNGVNPPGLASVKRWREVLKRASKYSEFLGVEEDLYPKDFKVFFRYHAAFETLPGSFAFPRMLTPEELGRFAENTVATFPVRLHTIEVNGL